jgi:Uma2 family endonuclease
MSIAYKIKPDVDEYPEIPGLVNALLPKSITEAYARPRGPYTIDNAEDWLDEYPLELFNGWLVWDKMTDVDERRIANNFEVMLDLAARDADYGQAFPDQVECKMADGSDYKPDVCVISHQSYETRLTIEGKRKRKLFNGAPELILELRSPSNTRANDALKREKYFANGAILIWNIEPRRQKIWVYHRDNPETPQEYRSADTITCELFPGWERQVADFFAFRQTVRQMVGKPADRWEAETRSQTKQNMILMLAETRFGKAALPEDLAKRLAKGTPEQLDTLATAIIKSDTLENWLALLPAIDK